ncbi:MAG: GGDEF domain-containing protein [Candidatus Micrarchaeaceae archaeon]
MPIQESLKLKSMKATIIAQSTKIQTLENKIQAQEGEIQALKELVRTDMLSGLLNRRAFDERCMVEDSRMARTHVGKSHNLAILLLDVDGFKDVNDKQGHAAGDDILRQVGSAFKVIGRRSERAADTYRYGGDEFVIVHPLDPTELDIMEGAKKQAERFKAEMRKLGLSVSIGVATLTEGGTMAETVKIADKRMYQDKRQKSLKATVRPDPDSIR